MYHSSNIGFTANSLYNKVYSFYYCRRPTYKKEGFNSLLEAKRALLGELNKLTTNSWSIPAEDTTKVAKDTTSKANKSKKPRTPIDYKLMTFKKNFPNLFIFKDFIFKQAANDENLVFIQKILTIIIKGTFLPLLILSFYIWIRRYFLWTSGLFTTSYIGWRFAGENNYVDKISDIVGSIRDGIVKIVTNLVGVFLNVDLVNREQVYAQVRAEAMAKMAQYEYTIKALESKVSSLPPQPKGLELTKGYTHPGPTGDGCIVLTAKTKVHTPLGDNTFMQKYHNLDPYIDKVGDFIHNHIPELNSYTVGVGVAAFACTVAYFYGTGGYDKPIINGIKGILGFIGNVFLGLATMTTSGEDSSDSTN